MRVERSISELARKKKTKNAVKSNKKQHQSKIEELRKVGDSIKSNRL